MHDVLNPPAPRHRNKAAALALALLCAATAPAQADEGAAPLRLSGFGSLGLSHSDGDWLFAREQTQVGAAGRLSALPDSRLGLQANWSPSERWEGVAQLVLRQRAKDSPVSESLEWAFIGYHPAPNWHLRLGRTSPDVFLQADVRNVGYALPWARPNVEFYGWMPVNTMDGADLSVDWQAAQADWRAKLSLGRSRSTVQDLRNDVSVRLDARKLLVLSLSRESENLLLKASYLRADLHISSPEILRQLQQGIEALATLPVPALAPLTAQAQALAQDLDSHSTAQYFSLGLQYNGSPWQATAELSRVQLASGMSGGWRAYASLGRRWRHLTGYLIAGRALPDRAALPAPQDWEAQLAPLLGPQAAAGAAALGAGAAGALNAFRFDQASVGLGLRYDFHQRMALKLQLDQVHTYANGGLGWRHNSAEPGHARVFSAVLDFVF
ncbi:hypothetical protein HNP55_000459 [Paucibacter oligotrophus]|uniref:Porin n=1 Tax=Roseateles oligotrophus TaxID=1769250 RepID=A0A840L0K8_9BURK|nr:hypothetical protein [Roseateles oligotrophus]MBB4841964.1 hypothetical protein [Roseateles oligotrophus]